MKYNLYVTSTKYKNKYYQWSLTYFLTSLVILFLSSSPFIHPHVIVAFSPSLPVFPLYIHHPTALFLALLPLGFFFSHSLY